MGHECAEDMSYLLIIQTTNTDNVFVFDETLHTVWGFVMNKK